MMTRFILFTLLCAAALTNAFGAAGDYIFLRQRASGPALQIEVTPRADDLLTFQNGVLTTVPRADIAAGQDLDDYLTIMSAASTYVSLTGSYTNPVWLVSLPFSKLTSTPTTMAGYGITDGLSLAAAQAAFQPLSTNLTSLAGTTSTAFGRSLLTLNDAAAGRTALGLGTLATQNGTISDYLTITAAALAYQPLDGDLTSIAGLSTTAYGRGLLTLADASAGRSALGLGTLATQSGNLSDYLTSANAALTYQPLDSDLTSIAGLTTTEYGRGFLVLADAAAGRTALGLGSLATQNGTISDYLTTAAAASAYQPLSSELTALAGVTGTVFGRSLLTQMDASATRTTLGLGTLATQNGNISDYLTTAAAALAYQPLDSDLTSIAGLTTTEYGRGFLVLADAAAGRTALGLGTLATQNGTISDYLTVAAAASTYLTSSSSLNASNLLSGTVADARLTANVTLLGSTISLTSEVTDTLPVLNGGTGATTAAGARLAILPSITGNAGELLRVNAGETDVEWYPLTVGDALTTNPLSQFASTSSSQLAGVISNETGTNLLVFSDGPTLTAPSIARLANFTVNGILTTTGGNGTLTVDTTTQSRAIAIEYIVACSDETTAITTGTAKVSFRVPVAMTVTSVEANMNTGPAGSAAVFDINEGGASILGTKISVDDGETSSADATTPPTITDTSIAARALITIDFDQVGASSGGTGVKITIIGTRN